MTSDHDYHYLISEPLDEGRILRITLNRPASRNAQNRGLLEELDHALLAAEADDVVRVVVLAGAGPSFSSGHDVGSAVAQAEMAPGSDQLDSFRSKGATRIGAEQRMLQEWHFFFQNTLRWRNLRKITLAQVHGSVLAGGLVLMWACDLIVAADNTVFADVVGTRFGMCGLEYFAHPWEFGPRKTKELMLTGDSLTAAEAHALGMVSRVVPLDALAEETLAFARRIAALPTMTALMVKECVNQTVDNMGFTNSLQACFHLHQLNHAHWAEIHEDHYPAARPEDFGPAAQP